MALTRVIVRGDNDQSIYTEQLTTDWAKREADGRRIGRRREEGKKERKKERKSPDAVRSKTKKHAQRSKILDLAGSKLQVRHRDTKS